MAAPRSPRQDHLARIRLHQAPGRDLLRATTSPRSPAKNLHISSRQLTEHVITGFEASNNTSIVPQGGNGDMVSITIGNINPTEQPQGGNDDEITNMSATNEHANLSNVESPKLLSRSLLTVSLITLSMVMATVFYKAPAGVVFAHHRLVYYLTLSGIFVAGLVEALTAIWISCPHDAHKPRYSFGRVVLCASIVPFVTIVAIGGFAFIDG